MTDAQQLQNVVGVVDDIKTKKGTNDNGEWKKTGAKVAGGWYSTFSDSDAEIIEKSLATGQPVSIEFETKGQYKNIKTIALMGAAPAADQAATATSAPPPAGTVPGAGDYEQLIDTSGLRKDKLIDLAKWEAEGYLVIYPTDSYVREISKRHVVRLEVVNPDPEQDFYEQGSGMAPTKRLLLKVADAGGLRWDADRCGFETNLPLLKVFKAVGHVRVADGTMKAVIGHKEVDLEVEIGEIEDRAKDLKKGSGQNRRDATAEEKADYIRSETLRLKKHAASNAETKAYLRAVRAAFQLPAAFTAKEIRRPWLIPRIDFELDYDNPEVQTQLAAAGEVAAGELYGGSHTPPAGYGAPEPSEEGDDDVPF